MRKLPIVYWLNIVIYILLVIICICSVPNYLAEVLNIDNDSAIDYLIPLGIATIIFNIITSIKECNHIKEYRRGEEGYKVTALLNTLGILGVILLITSGNFKNSRNDSGYDGIVALLFVVVFKIIAIINTYIYLITELKSCNYMQKIEDTEELNKNIKMIRKTMIILGITIGISIIFIFFYGAAYFMDFNILYYLI